MSKVRLREAMAERRFRSKKNTKKKKRGNTAFSINLEKNHQQLHLLEREERERERDLEGSLWFKHGTTWDGPSKARKRKRQGSFKLKGKAVPTDHWARTPDEIWCRVQLDS